jgi:dihydrolipoamide dehydrogenase
VTGVEADPAGGTIATLKSGKVINADKVLLSIGRRFNTEDLGLTKLGLTLTPRGAIDVDRHLMTRVPGIYAAGDVIGGPLLAHVAAFEALTAVRNIAGIKAEMDYRVVPAAVFTEPEIGSVGLKEHEAAAKDIPYKTGTCEMRSLGRAHTMGEISGLCKIIAHAETGRVLGVHIIGARASDLIAEAALAMQLGATAKDLAQTIHAHPTLAEVIYEAAREVE